MRRPLLAAIFLLLAASEARAAYTISVNYSGYATDVYGRPTPGVPFRVRCFAPLEFWWENWAYSGADGRFQISATLDEWPDRPASCTFERIRERDRRFDFDGRIYTTMPTAYMQLYDGQTGTVYHESHMNTPAIDARMDAYTVAGASVSLFQSGAYDKPIMVFDGFDPTNGRNEYAIWEQASSFMEWYAQGLDVWVVNYEYGTDGVASHIDESAWAIYRAMTWNGGWHTVSAVVGLSTGGVVARGALALWEHVRAGGSPPYAWNFTFHGTALAAPHTVKALITADSPHRGANVAPRSLILLIRKAIDMNNAGDMCKPKKKFGFIGALIGVTIGWFFLPGSLWMLTTAVGYIAPNEIIKSAHRSISLPQVKAALDSQGAKDLFLEHCSGQSSSSCTSSHNYNFFSTLESLNQSKGWPKQTRNVALAQGSWETQRCYHPDQWGKSTCSGCGYDVNGAWVCGERSSPNHIHTHGSNETFARLYPDRSMCSNHFDVTVAAKDLLPGSPRDMISSYLGEADAGDIERYFAPMFMQTTSATAMDCSGCATRADDVAWQNKALEHENLNNPVAIALVMGYVREYTHGDGDGFVTCNEVWSSHPDPNQRIRIKPYGQVGQLCSCDPDDGNTAITGYCNAQSRGPYCGDGVCNGSDDCSSCAADCGACPPPPSDPYSCAGSCGGGTGYCYCDSACVSYGDCCWDACWVCGMCGGGGGCDDPHTCEPM